MEIGTKDHPFIEINSEEVFDVMLSFMGHINIDNQSGLVETPFEDLSRILTLISRALQFTYRTKKDITCIGIGIELLERTCLVKQFQLRFQLILSALYPLV